MTTTDLATLDPWAPVGALLPHVGVLVDNLGRVADQVEAANNAATRDAARAEFQRLNAEVQAALQTLNMLISSAQAADAGRVATSGVDATSF